MTKLWITEYVDIDNRTSLGPYIKAETVGEANRIAIQYGLLVLGEIQERKKYTQLEERTVH